MGVVSKKEVGERKTAVNAALKRLKLAIKEAKLGVVRGSQHLWKFIQMHLRERHAKHE